MSINTSMPYPGAPLRNGSSGQNVKYMQYLLNGIQKYTYPSIGFLSVDGMFGAKTLATVKKYQVLKSLAADGVIGKNTWAAVNADFAMLPDGKFEIYPGVPVVRGNIGIEVEVAQTLLNAVGAPYTAIPKLTVDGKFGQNTADATRLFQKQFGLQADDKIGQKTWDMLVLVKAGIAGGAPRPVVTAYPGTPLSQGAGGDSVRFAQSYMNAVSAASGNFHPQIKIDGNYGANTRNMVIAFQKYFGLTVDGVLGAATWAKMIAAFNNTL